MEEHNEITWGGLVALAFVIGSLTAIFTTRPSTDPGVTGTLERIRRHGVVRIGFANEAPFGYLDTDTGRVTGEAPEIARALFARMQIARVETVSTDFGALIPGLRAGRFDVIAAGMYVTPQRCRQIAFTNPTYRIGEALIVPAGNPARLHGFEDVASASHVKLGVVAGAIELTYAQRLGIADHQLVLFGDNVAALDGVRSGRIDAFACTSLTATDLLRRAGNVGLEIAAPMRQPVIGGEEQVGYGAFGLRKADALLRAALDDELEHFIGTAEHLALVRPFGFDEITLPGSVTARDLCGGAN